MTDEQNNCINDQQARMAQLEKHMGRTTVETLYNTKVTLPTATDVVYTSYPEGMTVEEQNEQGRVCFNTTQIEYVMVGDAEDAFAADGEPLRVEGSFLSCSQLCPSTLDVMCAASQPACSDSLFKVAMVVVGVILGVLVCRKLGIGPCGAKKQVKVVHRAPPRSHRRRAEDDGFEPADRTSNPISPEHGQALDLEMKYGKD